MGAISAANESSREEKRQKGKQSLPTLIITSDFETAGLSDDFRLGACYDGGVKYMDVVFFDTVGEFIKILNDYGRNYKVVCYFHNLDFDTRYIYAEFKKYINRHGGIDIAGNAKRVKFMKNNDYPFLHNVELRDSYALIPTSLGKACKDFGLPKELWKRDIAPEIKKYVPCKPDKRHLASYPYKCEEPCIIDGIKKSDECFKLGYCKGEYFRSVDLKDEVFREYLKYDVISLFELIKVFKAQLTEITKDENNPQGLDVRLGLTTASTAMNAYAALQPGEYEVVKLNKWLEWRSGSNVDMKEHLGLKLVRDSYKGGRSEIFQHLCEHAWYYDVNSLYPTQMELYKFPVGPVYMARITREQFESYRKKGHPYIVRAKVRVPDIHIPPLPYHDKRKGFDKLVFPCGTFTDAFVSPELNFAIDEIGVEIVELYDCIIYETEMSFFEKFVAHVKPFKIHGKGAAREVAKLMQNSLYGKFGQREIETEAVRLELDKLDMLDKFNAGGWTRAEFVDSNTVWCFYKKEGRKLDHNYVTLASFITSYARLHWYYGAFIANFKVVAGDTDSIMTPEKLPDEVVDDTEYGKFKMEYEVEEIVALRPKWYAMRLTKPDKAGYTEIIKNKGIFTSFLKREIGFDGVKEFYQQMVRGRKRVEIVPRDAGILTTRKARDIFRRKAKSEQTYQIKDTRIFTKSGDLKDDKRRQLPGGIDTAPLVYDNDKLVED